MHFRIYTWPWETLRTSDHSSSLCTTSPLFSVVLNSSYLPLRLHLPSSTEPSGAYQSYTPWWTLSYHTCSYSLIHHAIPLWWPIPLRQHDFSPQPTHTVIPGYTPSYSLCSIANSTVYKEDEGFGIFSAPQTPSHKNAKLHLPLNFGRGCHHKLLEGTPNPPPLSRRPQFVSRARIL